MAHIPTPSSDTRPADARPAGARPAPPELGGLYEPGRLGPLLWSSPLGLGMAGLLLMEPAPGLPLRRTQAVQLALDPEWAPPPQGTSGGGAGPVPRPGEDSPVASLRPLMPPEPETPALSMPTPSTPADLAVPGILPGSGPGPVGSPGGPSAVAGSPGGVPGGQVGGVAGGKVGGIVPPLFDAAYLKNPAPDYPGLSRRLGEAGRVLLRVLVGPQGRAEQLQVHTSSGHARLDQAALDTVRRWRFVPARRGADLVQAWVLVPITFDLEA